MTQRTEPKPNRTIWKAKRNQTQSLKVDLYNKNETQKRLLFWKEEYLEQKTKEVTREYHAIGCEWIPIINLWNIVTEYVYCPIDLIQRELILHFSEFISKYSRFERVYGLLRLLGQLNDYDSFHYMRLILSYPLFIQEFNANPLRVPEKIYQECESINLHDKEDQLKIDQWLAEGQLDARYLVNSMADTVLGILTYHGEIHHDKIWLRNSWSPQTDNHECQCHRLLFEFGVTMGFIPRILPDGHDFFDPIRWGGGIISKYMTDVLLRADKETLSFLIHDLKWSIDCLVDHISAQIFDEPDANLVESCCYLVQQRQEIPSFVFIWTLIDVYVRKHCEKTQLSI
jgi:hypothetical protein